jgi:2-polyprenyl-3-methyl-5-hydroxy-6-metoxy-1,4-benzoquinol methylase
MNTDLTDPGYWAQRQQALHKAVLDPTLADLADAVQPYLRDRQGGRFIELGCSPGLVSACIALQNDFDFHGVDFAPSADMYLETMRAITGKTAVLWKADLRSFAPDTLYDVVASFGLIEHFDDPGPILDHHVRLCKPGGIILVTIPNFRHLQWLYHALLDAPDLARHNTRIMTPDYLRSFAARAGLETLFCGHAGRIAFWNYNREGSPIAAALRLAASAAVRLPTRYLLRPLLPPARPSYAPWIVFAGRRPD